MSSIALYRKYRSQDFEDLVGQDHVVKTLRNSIERNQIAQAYLFTGPRGTGKTSTARLLAKALNCTGGPSPTIPPDCPICAEIANGSCMDVTEIDAASESGVEDVRESIIQAAEYQPAYCRYKVFIIDEVHDLSTKAFDALLKTIEEPPAHVVFILATTEYSKVPITIRSRCQKFDFHRATIENLVKRLTYVCECENVAAEPSALNAIARLADGGFRDALTLLEQAIITADGSVTLDHVYNQLGLIADETSDDLLLAIADGNIPEIINLGSKIYQKGRDPRSIVESLLYRLSDLTRAYYEIAISGSGDAALEAGLKSTASRLGEKNLLLIRSELSTGLQTIRDITLPRIWLESELVRIARLVNLAPQAAPVAEVPVATQKPTITPKEPAKAVTTQPEKTEPLSPDEVTWRKVVDALSKISKLASARLPGSMVKGRQGKVIQLHFNRASDADWVEEKLAIRQAMSKEWNAITGEDVTFELSGGGAKRVAHKVEVTSVESPKEGEELVQAVRQVFGMEPPSNQNDG